MYPEMEGLELASKVSKKTLLFMVMKMQPIIAALDIGIKKIF